MSVLRVGILLSAFCENPYIVSCDQTSCFSPLFFLKLPATPCHGSSPPFSFGLGDDQLLQQSKPRDQSEPTQATNPTSLLVVLNLKSAATSLDTSYSNLFSSTR